jgi:hypothetical protein
MPTIDPVIIGLVLGAVLGTVAGFAAARLWGTTPSRRGPEKAAWPWPIVGTTAADLAAARRILDRLDTELDWRSAERVLPGDDPAADALERLLDGIDAEPEDLERIIGTLAWLGVFPELHQRHNRLGHDRIWTSGGEQ